MAYLVLVRHGQSQWNTLGLWTGWEDVPLDQVGREQAQQMAEHLRDIELHSAHTSKLVRAKQTLDEIKSVLGHTALPTMEHEALNERHYGVYQGKNKWQVRNEVGEEEFKKIRRSWDHPILKGESLKQVSERTLPYFEEQILTDLKAGKNVIVAAHGNSLRSIIKHLDNLSEDEISELEFGLGEVHIYEIGNDGKVIGKDVRAKNEKAGKI